MASILPDPMVPFSVIVLLDFPAAFVKIDASFSQYFSWLPGYGVLLAPLLPPLLLVSKVGRYVLGLVVGPTLFSTYSFSRNSQLILWFCIPPQC